MPVALAVCATVGATLAIRGRLLLMVVAAGVLDASANLMFAAGSQRGLTSVVAVLGSLYPVTTVVLAAVLLRLERGGEGLAGARLTEWFVEDMDGQLRQSGVGDLVVGKHVGKLMATLGGRIGALREALPAGGAALAQAIERNTTLVPTAGPEAVAERIARLHARLEAMPMPELLAGRLG